MNGFGLKRLKTLMEPEPGNPEESEGILNPAAVRGPEGERYVFPRLTARGNWAGGVTRKGVQALQPTVRMLGFHMPSRSLCSPVRVRRMGGPTCDAVVSSML